MNLVRSASLVRIPVFVKLLCLAVILTITAFLGNTYQQETLVLAATQDTSPPRIAYFEPPPGSTVATARPTIRARYADTESGINKLSIGLQLDGSDVTADATVTTSRVSYTPAALADGPHWVAITVSDNSGNQAHQVWSFQVDARSEETESSSLPQTTSALPSGTSEASNIASTLPPGTTEVSNIISNEGIFTEETTVWSEDEKCVLTINNDTKGLTKDGEVLDQITITEVEAPPAAPAYSNIITPVYEIGPDCATFHPPISLTISYEESLIPGGIAEEKLVTVMLDRATDSWSELASVVDPETNTITATVEHFSAFAILAHTRPANFIVSNLSITPHEAVLGESMSVSVSVTNTGDLPGTQEMTLEVDDVPVEIRDITIYSGDSKLVSFNINKDTTGIHTINIDGLSGTFKIRLPKPASFTISDISIAPTEVDIGERVQISATMTNTGDLPGRYEVSLKLDREETVYTKWVLIAAGEKRIVNFTKIPKTAGVYTVNVNGLSGSFVVRDITSPKPTLSPSTPSSINWSKIGGGMAILVLAIITFLFLSRKS